MPSIYVVSRRLIGGSSGGGGGSGDVNRNSAKEKGEKNIKNEEM